MPANTRYAVKLANGRFASGNKWSSYGATFRGAKLFYRRSDAEARMRRTRAAVSVIPVTVSLYDYTNAGC